MKHILKQFVRREAHPLIQFIKYGIAGGLATVTDIVLFSILGWKVFPCLKDGEWIVRVFELDVPQLSEAARTVNFILSKCVSFVFSNFVAYVTNVLWVFHPGRHSRRKEIFLFYMVSITSFVTGTLLGAALIGWFGMGAGPAYVANMVASVLINYACRKYLVFKG